MILSKPRGKGGMIRERRSLIKKVIIPTGN
jgi:hypothetical protein